MLNLLPSLQVSPVLGNVPARPPAAFGAPRVAKGTFISALTASLVRVLVAVWQALAVVKQKKPGNLAGIALCLPVCYFQHVNMNKHSSGLGDYWLRGFLAQHSSVKQTWK